MIMGLLLFGYYMNDPNKYGVIKLNKKIKFKIIENQKNLSKLCYSWNLFFDNKLMSYIKNKTSERNELEVCCLLNDI